jgi:hypothetical protein
MAQTHRRWRYADVMAADRPLVNGNRAAGREEGSDRTRTAGFARSVAGCSEGFSHTLHPYPSDAPAQVRSCSCQDSPPGTPLPHGHGRGLIRIRHSR